MKVMRLGAAILMFAVLAIPAGAGDRPFPVRVGRPVFVTGPHIESAAAPNCTQPGCWKHRLDVGAGGDRLRVAIDHPDHHDEFSLELSDPSGRVVGRASHGYLETPEIIVGPERGVWTLAVVGTSVKDTSFTVRAALENMVPRRPPGELLLPNLRPEPGFDFSLTTPLGSNYGLGTPVPTSCHADEIVDDTAVRCLRFSFGYQNAGLGPMDLRFTPLADLAATTTAASVRQRLYVSDRTPDDYSDNRFRDRDAGTATYHEVHGHYHYDAVFEAQLFKVEGRKLVRLGEAAKRGACAHDYVLVDFERIYQDPRGTADSGSDCNFTFTDPSSQRTRIGLSTGWADIYTLELSDNYVDFGLNGDGRYLVRVWADPDNTLAETNETDNVGYSLIEVNGTEVQLLERARGFDPWDKRKVELAGLGE